jgi:hypothetical protein
MKKIIVLIVVIAVGGFLAYNFFGKSDEPETGLVRNESVKVGADLLAALATLDTLRLDTDFFKDQTFRRLVNFSRDIPAQPKGRSNPFAPIGAANLPATTTNNQ